MQEKAGMRLEKEKAMEAESAFTRKLMDLIEISTKEIGGSEWKQSMESCIHKNARKK